MINVNDINMQPVNKTDMVCIKCNPAHIKGVCGKCENGFYIPEKEWLNIDEHGHRTYVEKYAKKLKESAKP